MRHRVGARPAHALRPRRLGRRGRGAGHRRFVVLLAQLAVVPWGEYADPAASWTHVVAAAAVVATIWAGRHRLPAEAAGVVREPALVLAVTTAVLGVADTVLDLHPALAVSAGTLFVATAVVAGLAWVLGRRTTWAFPVTVVGAFATAYLSALTLYAARTDSLLTALAGTAMALGLVAAAAVTELDDDEDVAPALFGGLALLGATYALPAWCGVADLGTRSTSLVITSYAVAVLLAARVLTRRTTTRVALEATAIVPALVGIALAPDTAAASLALTIVGCALAALAVVLRDRSYAAWGAVGVLALATWLRVETAADRPELWVLPVALVLLGVGLVQRRTTIVGAGLGGIAVCTGRGLRRPPARHRGCGRDDRPRPAGRRRLRPARPLERDPGRARCGRARRGARRRVRPGLVLRARRVRRGDGREPGGVRRRGRRPGRAGHPAYGLARRAGGHRHPCSRWVRLRPPRTRGRSRWC